jgi:hypothetical protein
MDTKLLTEFVTESLRYKNIKVEYYKVFNTFIDIRFDNGYGEIVEVERYNRWISERRQNKINEIIE